MVPLCLDFSLGADYDAAATGLECVAHALKSENLTSCRKVGSLDVLHQLLDCKVGIVNQGD